MNPTSNPRNRNIAERQAGALEEILAGAEAEVARRKPADEYLASYFRNHKYFGSRDRRFFHAAVFSWFRWKGWLDRLAPKVSMARRTAAAYYLDADTAHPAADVLAEKDAGGAGPMTPAGKVDLRGRAAVFARWFQLAEPPSFVSLTPDWTLGRLRLPPDEPDAGTGWIRSIQERPPTWIRITQPGNRDHEETLRRKLSGAEPDPRMPGAWFLPPGARLPVLMRETGYAFEVQDIGSQAVGRAADPQPDKAWWDVCAGAGGKSLHLAALMGNRGRIDATDPRRESIRELRKRAAKQNWTILRSRVARAEECRPDLLYDGVLVDAPCTGIGTWSRNPDMRWRTLEEDIEQCREQQAHLLAHSADFVKPGGKLVYALCTLTRDETFGVIEPFLRDRLDYRLEPFPHPYRGTPTRGTAFLYPSEGPGDGMFIAVMRRIDQVNNSRICDRAGKSSPGCR